MASTWRIAFCPLYLVMGSAPRLRKMGKRTSIRVVVVVVVASPDPLGSLRKTETRP